MIDELAGFWSKVDRRGLSDCWPWLGHLVRGYGQFYIRQAKRPVYAHRYAYELLVGPIPAGLVIDHLCRNPPCVNPAHLEPVTQTENKRRGIHASSKKRECKRGHPFAGDNLIVRPNGWRDCRECRRVEDRFRKRRVRAGRAA